MIKHTHTKAKWDNDYQTPKSKKGMWDGWSVEKLEAARSKLRAKEERTAVESKRLKEINFALRAKKNWKGKVSAASSSKKVKTQAGFDQLSHVAKKLVLHSENTPHLAAQIPYIQRNYARKLKKGIYDQDKAVKGWRNHFDVVARDHHHQHGEHLLGSHNRNEAAKYYESKYHPKNYLAEESRVTAASLAKEIITASEEAPPKHHSISWSTTKRWHEPGDHEFALRHNRVSDNHYLFHDHPLTGNTLHFLGKGLPHNNALNRAKKHANTIKTTLDAVKPSANTTNWLSNWASRHSPSEVATKDQSLASKTEYNMAGDVLALACEAYNSKDYRNFYRLCRAAMNSDGITDLINGITTMNSNTTIARDSARELDGDLTGNDYNPDKIVDKFGGLTGKFDIDPENKPMFGEPNLMDRDPDQESAKDIKMHDKKDEEEPDDEGDDEKELEEAMLETEASEDEDEDKNKDKNDEELDGEDDDDNGSHEECGDGEIMASADDNSDEEDPSDDDYEDDHVPMQSATSHTRAIKRRINKFGGKPETRAGNKDKPKKTVKKPAKKSKSIASSFDLKGMNLAQVRALANKLSESGDADDRAEAFKLLQLYNRTKRAA